MTGPRGLLSNAYSRAGRAAQNARGRGALGRLGYHRLFDLRPPNSIPPVWGYLWHLYQTVLERKPSLILEFAPPYSPKFTIFERKYFPIKNITK